jgi:hypothetical protein
MKVIFRNKGASTPLPGRNLFATVARASSNRLLDATIGRVTGWTDGEPIYVSSFGGSDWHWQADFPAATATDNETTCRPTSWIAGGLPGAAVRNLEGNRFAVSQAAWQINSTAADNEGAGTLADPLKTDVEIQRRWGPAPTIASSQITITYAQSPTVLTNFNFTVGLDGSVTFLGTRTVAKPAVTLTAVTTQNRATQTPWSITGATLGAADVGKLVIITASGTPANVGAYARILKDNGGGSVRVSTFGTFSIAASFTGITPAVGDVVDVVSLTTLNLGQIAIEPATSASPAASPARNCVIFDSLLLDGGPLTAGSVFARNVRTFYARCICQAMAWNGPSEISTHDVCGGGVVTGIFGVGSRVRLRKPGITSLGPSISGVGTVGCTFPQIDTDTYFQGCLVQANPGVIFNTQGVAWFDATVSGAINVQQCAVIRQTGAVADWGTNNAGYGLAVRSNGTYSYGTKPTTNAGLGAGREALVGGTDTLYAAIPAAGVSNAVNLASVNLFA